MLIFYCTIIFYQKVDFLELSHFFSFALNQYYKSTPLFNPALPPLPLNKPPTQKFLARPLILFIHGSCWFLGTGSNGFQAPTWNKSQAGKFLFLIAFSTTQLYFPTTISLRNSQHFYEFRHFGGGGTWKSLPSTAMHKMCSSLRGKGRQYITQLILEATAVKPIRIGLIKCVSLDATC